MQLTVEMAWVLAFAILLVVALLRTEAIRVLVPAGIAALGPRTQDEDEEQLPETDRAPRRSSPVLAYAVALTAAVRLGLLLTLHR